MASIKIKVGAALDANALAVFQPLEKAADRARRNIERALNAAGASGTKAPRQIATSWEKLERELEAEANKILRAEERAARGQVREAERAARLKVQAERRAAKEIEGINRDKARSAKAAADAEIQAEGRVGRGGRSGGGRIGIGRRASIGVSRGAAALYGYGGAAASAFARGIGVETDAASLIRSGVQNQSLATKLVNAGYIPGAQGAAGQLQNAGTVLHEVEQAANATATSTQDALEALRAFVGKTGDLDTGRKMLKDLATLSRATGSNLEDMANAAAEVTNSLGDQDNKAEKTAAIMRTIAGQGKLGAVEIKDLARQMAKLSSVAGFFEGDIGKNIGILGVMAQESKLQGGSSTATQAAGSISAFARDLTKGKTIKNFAAAGINVFADAAKTKMRSPEELILEALKASDKRGKGADLELFGKLFSNAQSARAVKGFSKIYNEAGGGAAGAKAVDDEFKRLSAAALTQEEVTRAFNASMGTTEAKVVVFNNQMAQLAEKLAGQVVPAFEALAPKVLELTSGLVGWIASLTGASTEAAQQQAEEAGGKEAGTEALLRKSTKHELGPGGGITNVYSGEMLDTLRAQGTKRSAAIGALQTEIEAKDLEAAKAQKEGRFDIFGMHAAIEKSAGVTPAAERSEAAKAEAAKLREQQAKLVAENERSNVVLRQIYEEIRRGNAKATYSSAGPSSGAMPANSPPPE